MRLQRHLKVVAAVLIVASGLFVYKFREDLDIIAYNPNPLIRHFAPTWRSFKKIIDIPYLITGIFSTKDVPVYTIKLTKNDLRNLLNNLPNFPEENRLYEEFKSTVKAEFSYGDYKATDAKMRYRGKSPNHWNALKKSWQIQLPKDKPLGDRTTLRFFIPEDRGWAQIFLWNQIRKDLGLITLEASPARLVINERNFGIYILIEGWEESLFEKHARQFGKIFSDKNIDTRGTNTDLLVPEGAYRWYNRNDPEEKDGNQYPELVYLLWLTANAPDNIFEKEIGNILNTDTYMRWMVTAILSGNFHPGNNRENMNLYFDPSTGQLEPISIDANITPLAEKIDLSDNRIVNRLLQNKVFRLQFELLANSYLSDTKNLEKALEVYDKELAILRDAAYRDTTKIVTSYEVTKTLEKDRRIFEENFRTLTNMLKTKSLDFNFANETYPLKPEPAPTTIKSFQEISATRAQFLIRNPQFVAGKDADTIILFPGAYTFSRDVIIPKNLSVVIREGVTIFMAPDVSVISYSTLRATGTQTQPITIRPLVTDKPWGVFTLMNAPNTNEFNSVRISGGKDATINGVYFSGMLSAHNSNVLFANGRIENAHADDGIHVLASKAVIENSVFNNNFADSIDLDFIKDGSRITNNHFSTFQKEDLNGDAIDLSFSSLPVTKNTVESCSDKGISVGEASTPNIEYNTIKYCAYGIAIKDRSKATIAYNTFEENKTAIGLYRKKPHFIDGGIAILINNIFTNNGADTSADKYSRIEYANF